MTMSAKYSEDLNLFRAVLIVLMILVHIVHFGEIHPDVKDAVLSFLMPSFLLVTGYLVRVDKPFPEFLRYLWRIFLPYLIMVTAFALLSLHLPVRNGLTELSVHSLSEVIFVQSIGPYWFLHTMITCGTLYYAAFRCPCLGSTAARYAIFAVLIILLSTHTPLLSLKAAAYYFAGAGIRQFAGDFSCIYRPTLWAILPFGMLVVRADYHDWGAIAVPVCCVCFFSAVSATNERLPQRLLRLLHYIGRNTFPIYIFHPIFTMASKFVLPLFAFEPTGMVHAVCTIVFATAGSLTMAWLLDRSGLALILGRKQLLR